MLMTGARLILEALAKEGCEVVFGYPGGASMPIYDELYDHPIRHILVRHEENACFAAEGYARSTGKVGVCMATSGPGATNLVTGLVDAMMDSIPVVAFTGQVPKHLIGRDAFQEADTFGITRSCTKHNYLVKDINELVRTIHEAFYIASTGRPGPVLIDVTKDTLVAKSAYHAPGPIHLRGYKPSVEGHAGQIKRAAKMIWEAERPYVYAGGGIIKAGASAELDQLARIVEAPVAETLMGLGALPSEHPYCLNMLGMHGSYAANMGISNADLLIALGVRFDDRVTGRLDAFARHAKVLHVDIDPAEIGKNRHADLPIVGDLKQVLDKLNKLLAGTKDTDGRAKAESRRRWLEQIHEWQRQHPFQYTPSATEIKPQFLVQQIDEICQGEAIVCADVGQHQMWAAQYVRFHRPRLWLNSGGLGAMGFGLPAAIGAQMGNPDKLVIALLGDGGFQMSIPELSTIVSYGLPIKIVIMNNGYLGMVRQWQELFYNRRYCAVEMDAFPDCEKLAAAFGMKGRTVEKPDHLPAALKEAVEDPGPYLLNVKVSPEESVYPMVPSGGAVNEMILGEPQPVEAGD
ncbi:MAG TPA: biosynthetic-type acetolactate synthase large subunit [Bryobacterales bacterium]|nr:biosynthetic-type acetolactate synthase large subunit [Bryobacterales bacterium]